MIREEIIKVDGSFYNYEISEDGKVYTVFGQDNKLLGQLQFSRPLLDEIEKVHGCSASELLEETIRNLIKEAVA